VTKASRSEIDEMFPNVAKAAETARKKGYEGGNDYEVVARYMTQQDPKYVNKSRTIFEEDKPIKTVKAEVVTDEPTKPRMKSRAEWNQRFEKVKESLYEAGVSTVKAAKAQEEMYKTALGALAEAYEGSDVPSLPALPPAKKKKKKDEPTMTIVPGSSRQPSKASIKTKSGRTIRASIDSAHERGVLKALAFFAEANGL